MRAQLDARLETGQLELPVLPSAAMEVSSVCSQEDYDVQKLTRILRSDQTLAAHLLRLANSPLYRPRAPIESLEQAIARLGRVHVRELSLAIACKTRVFSARGYEAEISQLFDHSLAVALFAQEVAKRAHIDAERCFLAGLLHDVGRAVVLQTIVDIAKTLHVTPNKPAVLVAMTRHHERAGVVLGEAWELPKEVVAAIGHHHTNPPADIPLVHAVQLADELAHCCLDDVEPDALLSLPAVEWLRFDAGDVEALWERAPFIGDAIACVA